MNSGDYLRQTVVDEEVGKTLKIAMLRLQVGWLKYWAEVMGGSTKVFSNKS